MPRGPSATRLAASALGSLSYPAFSMQSMCLKSDQSYFVVKVKKKKGVEVTKKKKKDLKMYFLLTPDLSQKTLQQK